MRLAGDNGHVNIKAVCLPFTTLLATLMRHTLAVVDEFVTLSICCGVDLCMRTGGIVDNLEKHSEQIKKRKRNFDIGV